MSETFEPLPVDVVNYDPRYEHANLHNQTNQAVNDLAEHVETLPDEATLFASIARLDRERVLDFAVMPDDEFVVNAQGVVTHDPIAAFGVPGYDTMYSTTPWNFYIEDGEWRAHHYAGEGPNDRPGGVCYVPLVLPDIVQCTELTVRFGETTVTDAVTLWPAGRWGTETSNSPIHDHFRSGYLTGSPGSLVHNPTFGRIEGGAYPEGLPVGPTHTGGVPYHFQGGEHTCTITRDKTTGLVRRYIDRVLVATDDDPRQLNFLNRYAMFEAGDPGCGVIRFRASIDLPDWEPAAAAAGTSRGVNFYPAKTLTVDDQWYLCQEVIAVVPPSLIVDVTWAPLVAAPNGGRIQMSVGSITAMDMNGFTRQTLSEGTINARVPFVESRVFTEDQKGSVQRIGIWARRNGGPDTAVVGGGNTPGPRATDVRVPINEAVN